MRKCCDAEHPSWWDLVVLVLVILLVFFLGIADSVSQHWAIRDLQLRIGSLEGSK